MRSRFRFTIRSKIILGYMAAILCFIVALVFVDDQINTMREERNYVIEHDIAVHSLTNRIEKHMLSMETGQRGFTITGDQEYLEPYNYAKANWLSDYLQLYRLVEDNPTQLAKLAEIRPLIEHWIEVAGDVAVALKRENRNEALLQFYMRDPGKQDMNEIRVRFEAFLQTEKELTAERADKLSDRNEVLRTILYGMLAVIAIVSISLATWISGSIVRTIREVIRSITEILTSGGVFTQRIKVNTRDEIGDLGRAANLLLDNQERKNWLQTKLAEGMGMYQGIEDIGTLGQTFITRTAPLLKANYGVLYIRAGKGENRKFVRWASYAAEDEATHVDSFKPGEGLVGQCAVENRLIHLDQVPDTYIRVVSGLGRTAPHSVVIAPSAYEGEVTAVLELAALQPFEPIGLQLLEELLDSLGLAINSVESRMEIERLLRESQAMTEELQSQAEELQTQAEELQTQQEELRVSNEHLEEQNRYSEQKSKELEQIRIELEEYTEQLKQSTRYKSSFLANMSHELRTPLNSMLILSQLLSENTNLSEEEQQYAKVIHSAGNDLLDLINDILDLSKVEAGKIDVIVEETSIAELPTIMQYQFGKVAEQKGIEFSVQIDSDVPTIFWTDERRLHQILRNLLSNAFKFTEGGSVSLQIGLADAKRFPGLLPIKRSGTVLAFSVADTGIGIPSNKQEEIFEAFRQADDTTSRKYGGTGLGLSICRELAKLLGGTIVVESTEGQGSIFTLLLPSSENGHTVALAEASEEVAAGAEPNYELTTTYVEGSLHEGGLEMEAHAMASDNAILERKRVLVVDDDTRNIFALRSILEEAGIEVTVAGNGQECLELLGSEERFDLILMDIMMPVLDGYATMRRIRAIPQFERLPIIALTAKAMKFDREKCLEAGASDYISKPLNMPQLFSLMRVWLTRG